MFGTTFPLPTACSQCIINANASSFDIEFQFLDIILFGIRERGVLLSFFAAELYHIKPCFRQRKARLQVASIVKTERLRESRRKTYIIRPGKQWIRVRMWYQ
jgi:hypothetical protein